MMQRLFCVATLIAIAICAPQPPVNCDNPSINVFSVGNGTFSKAGVLRFMQGVCGTLTGPKIANLDASRFNMTEAVPSSVNTPGQIPVFRTTSPQESMLQWMPLTPVQSLYTVVLIDVSGTQASHLADVATILQLSLLPVLKNVHGETMVTMFDGSNIYWVQNFTSDHEDALKTAIKKLNGYTVQDNSTNLWAAIEKAQIALTERLNQTQLLDSGLRSEYAHGSVVLISNGRDTCGCYPVNNLAYKSVLTGVSIAIGDDVDNATMTSWFGSNRAYYDDFNAKKDQNERNNAISQIYNEINQTIAYNAQGIMALRYCSPRRGSPLADVGKLFKFDVSYNGRSLGAPNYYSYNATSFGPGCTLDSAAVSARSIAALVIAALFFLSF